MPIIKDGTTVKAVNFNGTSIKKVLFNGTVVFTAEVSVYWEIRYYWDDTGSACSLKARILDSEPLSPTDVIKVRVKDNSYSPTYIEVELTTANPEQETEEYFMFFNSTNAVEILLNNTWKATGTWNRPNKWSSSTKSGTETFVP